MEPKPYEYYGLEIESDEPTIKLKNIGVKDSSIAPELYQNNPPNKFQNFAPQNNSRGSLEFMDQINNQNLQNLQNLQNQNMGFYQTSNVKSNTSPINSFYQKSHESMVQVSSFKEIHNGQNQSSQDRNPLLERAIPKFLSDKNSILRDSNIKGSNLESFIQNNQELSSINYDTITEFYKENTRNRISILYSIIQIVLDTLETQNIVYLVKKYLPEFLKTKNEDRFIQDLGKSKKIFDNLYLQQIVGILNIILGIKSQRVYSKEECQSKIDLKDYYENCIRGIANIFEIKIISFNIPSNNSPQHFTDQRNYAYSNNSRVEFGPQKGTTFHLLCNIDQYLFLGLKRGMPTSPKKDILLIQESIFNEGYSELKSHNNKEIALKNAHTKIQMILSKKEYVGLTFNDFDEVIKRLSSITINSPKTFFQAAFENCTTCHSRCFLVTFPCLNSKLFLQHQVTELTNIIKLICQNQCSCKYQFYDKKYHFELTNFLNNNLSKNLLNFGALLKAEVEDILLAIEEYIKPNDITTNKKCAFCNKDDINVNEFCNNLSCPSRYSHYKCLNDYIIYRFKDGPSFKCPSCDMILNKPNMNILEMPSDQINPNKKVVDTNLCCFCQLSKNEKNNSFKDTCNHPFHLTCLNDYLKNIKETDDPEKVLICPSCPKGYMNARFGDMYLLNYDKAKCIRMLPMYNNY